MSRASSTVGLLQLPAPEEPYQHMCRFALRVAPIVNVTTWGGRHAGRHSAVELQRASADWVRPRQRAGLEETARRETVAGVGGLPPAIPPGAPNALAVPRCADT